MKRSSLALAAMLLLAAFAAGHSMAQGSGPAIVEGHHGGFHGGMSGHHGFSPGGFSNLNILSAWPGYGSGFSPYPYPFNAAYGYPTYPYTPPYVGTYSYIGPLYVPAEEMYGPRSIARFLGWGPVCPPPAVPNVVVTPPADAAPAVAPAAVEEMPPVRGTNAQAVALGRRNLATGDRYFADQKYTSAYQRYAQAIRSAPRLPDAYLRQGFTLIAMGRYDQSAQVLKRCAGLDASLNRLGFRLDSLYGANRMAKESHIDSLAKAATDQPNNADLLFLLGMFLHFDGQTDRAKPFFQRAAQLTGDQRSYLVAFLN